MENKNALVAGILIAVGFPAVIAVAMRCLSMVENVEAMQNGYEQVDGEWKPTELTREILSREAE